MNTDKKEYGISVIMPCYNTEQYVEETLKSVLNQSFKDYEIICLNDGSTDGTLEILKRYQQSYPNIRVISSENHGVAYQRNTGVQCAQGKYIYYMDSDDLLKENCLETLYQYAEADNLDIVYFEADSFYETKEIEEAFPQFLTLYHRHKEYDGIYDGRNLYIQMENAGQIWKKVPGFSQLVDPGFYTWILLLLAGYLIYRKRTRDILLLIGPAINILICIASPVNGLLRYALPLMACTPLLIYLTVREEKESETEGENRPL